MTAIASVCTPEGFVIGADGRQTYTSGATRLDTVCKIFRTDAVNINAAYAWTGAVRLESGTVYFDFKEQSQIVRDLLEGEPFGSISEYIQTFSTLMYERLVIWSHLNGASFGADNSMFVSVLMVGYAGGTPEMAEVHFPYRMGVLRPPITKLVLETPTAYLNIFSGCSEAHEKMCNDGGMWPPKTIAAGVQLVGAYLQECVDSSAAGCEDMGGHIHIAAVTPNGSHWRVQPKF